MRSTRPATRHRTRPTSTPRPTTDRSLAGHRCALPDVHRLRRAPRAPSRLPARRGPDAHSIAGSPTVDFPPAVRIRASDRAVRTGSALRGPQRVNRADVASATAVRRSGTTPPRTTRGDPGTGTPAASTGRPDGAPRGADPGPAGSASPAPPMSAGSPPQAPRREVAPCASRLLSLAAVALVAAACGSCSSSSRRATSDHPDPPQHHQPTSPPRAPEPAPDAIRRGHLRGPRQPTPPPTPTRTASRPSRWTSTPPRTPSPSASSTTATCPIPASIRVEEWVNAFDQGYPAARRRHVRGPRRRGADPVRRRSASSCSGSGSRPASRRERHAPGRRPHLRHRHLGFDGARGSARARQGFAAQARPRRSAAAIRSRSSPSATTPASSCRRPGRPTRKRILAAIDELQPGGSTNLEAGLRLGYGLARETLPRRRHRPDRPGLRWRRQRRADRRRRHPAPDPRRRRRRHRAGLGRRRDGQLQRRPARAAGRPGRRLLRLRQRPRRGAPAVHRGPDRRRSRRSPSTPRSRSSSTPTSSSRTGSSATRTGPSPTRTSAIRGVDAGAIGAGHAVTALYALTLRDGFSRDDVLGHGPPPLDRARGVTRVVAGPGRSRPTTWPRRFRGGRSDPPARRHRRGDRGDPAQRGRAARHGPARHRRCRPRGRRTCRRPTRSTTSSTSSNGWPICATSADVRRSVRPARPRPSRP